MKVRRKDNLSYAVKPRQTSEPKQHAIEEKRCNNQEGERARGRESFRWSADDRVDRPGLRPAVQEEKFGHWTSPLPHRPTTSTRTISCSTPNAMQTSGLKPIPSVGREKKISCPPE